MTDIPKPGWAYEQWASKASDTDLREEAHYKIALKSGQWLQIEILKREMEKRGLPYALKTTP